MTVLLLVQGASDTLGLGGEGGSGASDAAGASYLDAFAAFRDEVRLMLLHRFSLALGVLYSAISQAAVASSLVHSHAHTVVTRVHTPCPQMCLSWVGLCGWCHTTVTHNARPFANLLAFTVLCVTHGLLTPCSLLMALGAAAVRV